MKYFFLIASFNALFFAVLLLQKKPRALHDHVLIFWLVYLGLFTAIYAFSPQDLFTRKQLLSSGIISLFMLHGPFHYLYISALTSKKSGWIKRDFLHFTPFAGFITYLLISSLFPDYADRIRMDHVSTDFEPPMLFVFFLLLTAMSGPVYFVLSTRLFRKLDINIFNNFSYSEEIDLDWLRKLVYIFGIIWSALIVIAIVHHLFHLFSMAFCTDGLFLSLSVFIILIGYFGLRQKEIFTNFPVEDFDTLTESKTKYAGLVLKETDVAQYITRIKNYMDTDKPYLDADLTLQQLASSLEIPSHHLSRVVNEKFGYHFFDFINHYRVEEVKIKISDPKFQNYSFLGVAYECGFNSKSAFNRVFKKTTGLTPSEYQKTIK